MDHIAKVFMNGRSQAVRLPKELRFDCDEVFIRKQGDQVIISSKTTSWDDFFTQESAFDDKFLASRDQQEIQERDF